jgi:hypothetical protein
VVHLFNSYILNSPHVDRHDWYCEQKISEVSWRLFLIFQLAWYFFFKKKKKKKKKNCLMMLVEVSFLRDFACILVTSIFFNHDKGYYWKPNAWKVGGHTSWCEICTVIMLQYQIYSSTSLLLSERILGTCLSFNIVLSQNFFLNFLIFQIVFLIFSMFPEWLLLSLILKWLWLILGILCNFELRIEQMKYIRK